MKQSPGNNFLSFPNRSDFGLLLNSKYVQNSVLCTYPDAGWKWSKTLQEKEPVSVTRMGPKRKLNAIIDVNVSADSLLATGVESIVASVFDEAKILELIQFSKALQTASTAALKATRLAAEVCRGCEKESATRNCCECNYGFCDEETCGAGECKDCENCICEDCMKLCDFDDGCGGGGCGYPMCGDCYTTTKCEREVGGCQECFDDYQCPDCDQCAGYW